MYYDHCPIPDIAGICKYEDREETYFTITPKDCFTLALLNNNVHLDYNAMDAVWGDFLDIMIENGYLEEEGE
jgi:hypothetical protein